MNWGLLVVVGLFLSPVILLGLGWLASFLFSGDDGHAERARRRDERDAAETARQARQRRRREQYDQFQEHRRSVAALAAGGAAAGALAFDEESPLDEEEKWRPIGSDPFHEMMEVSSVFDDGPCGSINPASGLPMVGCVDVAGNPYGTDSSDFGGFSGMDGSGDTFDAVSDSGGYDPFGSSYGGCD